MFEAPQKNLKRELPVIQSDTIRRLTVEVGERLVRKQISTLAGTHEGLRESDLRHRQETPSAKLID